MKRILWVKGGKLLPVDTGGKIRSYNILRHLAQRHHVTLLSYYPGRRDTEYELALEREFPGAIPVALGDSESRIGQAVHYAVRVPRAAPYSVTKFTSPRVGERVGELLESGRVDVAVCDFLLASLNFPTRPTVPTVLFQHNVESALWRRTATYERNPAKKALFKMEAWKMHRYERAALTRFDHVVAVSDHDKALMHAMAPAAPITVVPTGVDVIGFTPPAAVRRSNRTVMFLGSMDWPANIDGVEYFCEAVWPLVLAAAPDARFQVVGRKPPERILRFAGPSVEIAGGVKSVLPHLHAAAVFVVPLRIGGGTRLKIYEAMAAGVPIVSTTVGAEGLDVRDREDILLADNPAQFADAVVKLLQQPDLRRSIAANAAATAARFDWSVIATAFEGVLDRAMARARPSGV
ncbi:MAG TPA: glycosyltransferase family 4 protein [Gemmatimonadaceae bacterium]